MMMMILRHQRTRVFQFATSQHVPFSTFQDTNIKKKKMKIALVTGYTGTGYHGVQIQETKDVPTIEYDVREALFKAGCILESNYGDMSKIGWSRSSRTDKGVHATSIVLSGKFLVYDHQVDMKTGRINELPEQLNQYLPSTIRIFTATKVHQSFRAREDCILREYDYFLPLNFLEKICDPGTLDQTVHSIIETLPYFEGIHDFHNLTKQRRYFYKLEAKKKNKNPEKNEKDISIVNGQRKTLQRHRRTIYNCHGTLVNDFYGMKYIRIHFTGASFLLNQIRCMVGAAIAVGTGELPFNLFQAALHTNQVIQVPIAPAEGLILSNCSFSTKENLLSLVFDHNTPTNLNLIKNPNQAPHRVLINEKELKNVLEFRNNVIYKEINRSWNESENVQNWREIFNTWKETLNEIDRIAVLDALNQYQENETQKAAASARVVQEARLDQDELKLLPRAFSTAVSIRFGLTPGIYVTELVNGLKKSILQGKLPIDATHDDLFEYMEKIGLDRLATIGRKNK